MFYEVFNYKKGFGLDAGTFNTAKQAKAAREFTASAKQMSTKHGRYWQELQHDHSEIRTFSSKRAFNNNAEPIKTITTFKL